MNVEIRVNYSCKHNKIFPFHLRYLTKYFVVFTIVVHSYFYIVVRTQRGCRNLKKNQFHEVYFRVSCLSSLIGLVLLMSYVANLSV